MQATRRESRTPAAMDRLLRCRPDASCSPASSTFTSTRRNIRSSARPCTCRWRSGCRRTPFRSRLATRTSPLRNAPIGAGRRSPRARNHDGGVLRDDPPGSDETPRRYLPRKGPARAGRQGGDGRSRKLPGLLSRRIAGGRDRGNPRRSSTTCADTRQTATGWCFPPSRRASSQAAPIRCWKGWASSRRACRLPRPDALLGERLGAWRGARPLRPSPIRKASTASG